MQAKIVGIRQELSFENGESSSYMVLRLPNGVEIQTLVDDAAVHVLTEQFVQEGGAAAGRAVAEALEQNKKAPVAPPARSAAPQIHPALAHNMESTQANMARAGEHTPLRLEDDANSDYVFGGSDSDEYQEEDVQGIQEQFRAASDRIIGAVEGSSSLSEAAKLLGNGDMALPVPSWAADSAQTEKAPVKKARSLRSSHVSTVAVASAVQVEADAQGNPVLHGAGLIDPHDLTGPSDEEGEAGQL